ncbi:hypothetical protein PanWU01x14_164360, partial [Parasponia andersonii]
DNNNRYANNRQQITIQKVQNPSNLYRIYDLFTRKCSISLFFLNGLLNIFFRIFFTFLHGTKIQLTRKPLSEVFHRLRSDIGYGLVVHKELCIVDDKLTTTVKNRKTI